MKPPCPSPFFFLLCSLLYQQQPPGVHGFSAAYDRRHYYNRQAISCYSTAAPSKVTPPPTIPAAALATLRDAKVAVIPDFISPQLVSALLRDVEGLRSSGAESQCAAAEHGSVQWFELLPTRPRGHATPRGREELYNLVAAVQDGIEQATRCRLDAPLTELKYAYYPHGGHYRRHVDALNAGLDTTREFSFILYLNDEWQERHGGHLRIFDFDDVAPHSSSSVSSGDELERQLPFSAAAAGSSAGGDFVDVAPAAGTMVIFVSFPSQKPTVDRSGLTLRCVWSLNVQKSDTVPHEVMPTAHKRVAIVGWFNRLLTQEEVREKEEQENGEGMSPLAAAILQHYRQKGEVVKF